MRRKKKLKILLLHKQIKALRNQRHKKTVVCYGADAAIKEIDEYMSIEKIGV